MNGLVDRQLLSLILSERLPGPDWESFSHTGAEWDAIVRLAQADGVAPLLYGVLSQSGRLARLPEALQTFLRAMYLSTRMNNEQILGELERLTGLFAEAGIPVVALKGACFALTIYPDLGLRPMADLDLLVPAARRSEALQIAQTLGYGAAQPEASPGLDGLLNHAVCLAKTTLPFTTLELHTTLVAEASFTHAVPVDWFWSQTEPIRAVSLDRRIDHLLMLTPTAQVLYACAHAMLQHGGRNTSLRWLYDLHRLLRAYAGRIDWDLLVAQARRFEWSSAVAAALTQTVAYFATPLLQNVLQALSTHADRNRGRVASLQEQPASRTLVEYEKLKSLHGSARLRLFLALAVPGPAYMCWRYGLKSSWTLPAWYLYRWWDILKDAGTTALLRLQKVTVSLDKRSPGSE